MSRALIASRIRRIALIAWLSGCVFVSFAPARAAEPAAGRSAITAETLWKLQRLSPPSVSPDGAWAVLGVTGYELKEDKGKTDLWLVPTGGGEPRRLTTHDASDSSPSWSPDGQWIAFESKRDGDDETQIYVIPFGGGEARRVTKVPTGAGSAKWFPDSKSLAFISWVWKDLSSWEEQGKRLKEKKDSKVSAKVWDKPIIRYWDHWVEDRNPHLYAISIDGGEPRPLTPPTGRCLPREEPGLDSYDISPDGQEIAFASDVDTTGVDQNYDVFTVPIGGTDARDISPENPADDFSPLYSPDGRWLAFSRQTIKGFYADRARLVLRDRRAGTNRVATEGWDRSVSGLVWSPRSDALYGAIDDAGNGRVHRVEVPSGRPVPLTRDRSFSALSLSDDGRTLVALRQSFVEPPTLVTVDISSGAATKISAFNDAVLAGVEWGTYESVTFKGARNEDVQMWVNYPPGFDRSRKWPVFLILHGGPH